MGIFAEDDLTPFAPLRKVGGKPDGGHQLKHAISFGNEIQTFSADFTTARAEGTDRNGAMGMYSGERDRWVGEIRVEWKGR